MNRLTVIGCGPGAREYMTLAAVDNIDNAPIIMGTSRLLELVNDQRRKCIKTSAHSKEAILEIEEQLKISDVSVLVTGDATLFSLGNSLMDHFDHVDVIPGISSVQLAYARLAIPFHNSRSFSAHGRLPKINDGSIEDLDSFSVLCGTKEGQKFAISLVNKLDHEFYCYALIDLSLDTEQIIKLEKDTLTAMPVYSRMLVIYKRKNI